MKRISLLMCLLLAILTNGIAQVSPISFTVNQAPCNNDGIVTSSWSGGTAPYQITYYFMNGTTVVRSGISATSDVYNTWDGTGFSAVVQDALGAVNDGYRGPERPFTVRYTTTPFICPVTPGAINTTVIAGGVAPFTYQYYATSNPATVISTSNPVSITTPGSYFVKVTDANGCVVIAGNGSNSGQQGDSMYVREDAPFEFDVTTTPANCTNGTAVPGVITGSGVAPYSYLWSNGSTSSTGISGLVSGSYSLTVTDANGCSFTRHFFVSQAITINANVTITNATCLNSDGAAIAFGSGGTAPYSYSWSNGSGTQGINGIAAGSYTVNVTDANGCTGTGYAYITSTTPVNVTYAATASSCTSPTGSATLNISGGLAPYTVNWNTYPAQTGTTANNLPAGNYSFNVTDANGCVRSGTAVIPALHIVNVDFSAIRPMCTAANGSINTTITGTGIAPYTYLWSNGANTASVSGLAAGNYSVTVTDANGCAVTRNHVLAAQSPINLGISNTPVTCEYATDASVQAIPSGGTAPYTYSWSGAATGTTASLTNVGMGSYYVNVTDAAGCTASSYTLVGNSHSSNSCYCTITGTVYNDANGNCIKDAGEDGIPNIGIHISGRGYAYTDHLGIYTMQVPSGNYTVSEVVQTTYPLSACQNNSNVVSITAGSGCTQTVDFANTISSVHDIRVNLWTNSFAVPGNSYHQQLSVVNDGTITETLPVAAYRHDGQLGAPSIAPSAVFTDVVGNWLGSDNNLTTLNPGQSAQFAISYNVPTNIPMGTGLVYYDSAVNAGPMSNWLNDYTPWNNVHSLNQTVVSSYDPNFIEVSPQGFTGNGNIERRDSLLTYRIHFQNSGTYYAQNIFILNQLDADLDWDSFKPAEGSHAYTASRSETGLLRFQFDNINLPWESMSEPGSQGYVTYTIKTKRNLPIGTQFKSLADIYFDYNAPIRTNETVNTLYQQAADVNDVLGKEESFRIFPNPANQSFRIKLDNVTDNNVQMSISDVAGKIVMTQKLSFDHNNVSQTVYTKELTAGIYFVSLNAKGVNQTRKLVILR